MKNPQSDNLEGWNGLQESIQRLETRVAQLETYLGLVSEPEPARNRLNAAPGSPGVPAGEEDSIEERISEFWLARVGAVLLLIGIAFFINRPFSGIPPLLSTLFSYLAVALVYFLAHRQEHNYPGFSRILTAGSYILLFYATLKLSFFTSNPIIVDKYWGLAALMGVLVSNFYFSWREKSQTISVLTILLAFFTALVANETPLTLGLITLTSGLSVYLMVKQNWPAVGLLGLLGAYSSHLIWLINNPVMGQPLHAVATHQQNLLYLFLYATCFGVATAFHEQQEASGFSGILATLANIFGVCIIGGFNILFFFKSQVSLLAFGTFIFFISLAAFHWYRNKSIYSTSFYSSFAHAALSIAIVFQFEYPDYFVWLSLQSLLVMITALLFRSRIIVLANIAIYAILYCYYLPFVQSNDYVNLSLAITALASARILNWKRQRLELKTDMIRNLYLVCAFIIVLYGLNQAVPRNFVSLTWLAAALFYFVVSWLLNNKKYRRMALLTILATVLHVMIIDLSKLSGSLRILSFVVVGLVLVFLSVVYTRYRHKL